MCAETFRSDAGHGTPLTATLSDAAWQDCHRLAHALAGRAAAGLPAGARGTIDFVLNELLENACRYRHSGRVRVRVRPGSDAFRCTVGNRIARPCAPALRSRLQWLTRLDDPGEQLRRHVESSPDRHGSGLGLLLLLGDYGARLGWTLQAHSPETLWLTIRVRCPIR